MKKFAFAAVLLVASAARAQTPSYMACTGSGSARVCSTTPGAVAAANVPIVVSPVAGDISVPLNAAIANCLTTANCSFLITAPGQVNLKDQIVVNKPNVSIACQNPAQTTLFGNALPTYTNASTVVTGGVASVVTTTPNTYVVGSFIFMSDGAGHSFNGYVNSVTDSTHYTMLVNNIDLPLVNSGSSQAISYFAAEADGFELSNCALNRGSGASGVSMVKVEATPWSTANKAKIHGNNIWSPYPSASTWGYDPVLPWEPGRSYPTGSKVYALNGTTTKYLVVATTGGISGLAHVTAYSQTGTDVTLTANNNILGAAPIITLFCSSGPVWLNRAPNQGRLTASSITPTSFHVTSPQSLTSASGPADCTVSQASGTQATAARTTPPAWNTTINGTTQDGTVTWTTEQTMTNDAAIGIQIVGWDTAHTANDAQVYGNTLNFSFIDLAIDTNANNTDAWGNTFIQGEAFDINGDRSWVTGTHIHHNYMMHTAVSSWVQDGDHTTLDHNFWWDYGGVGVAGIQFSNPFFGFYNSDNIIDGDQFVGSALSGPALTASQEQMGLLIQNVSVSYAGKHGIDISQGGISSFGTHIKGVTLKNNGQSSPGTGTYCGIHISTGSSATNLNLDITNSTALDDQPAISSAGVAANTTQAYALCADQSSPAGTAIKTVYAYGNNFPVSAWSKASGNGTAFNFPDGCTNCALNPTLPITGVGPAIPTGPSVTTPGNVPTYSDVIGTHGTGVAPNIQVNGQNCPLGGTCTIVAGASTGALFGSNATAKATALAATTQNNTKLWSFPYRGGTITSISSIALQVSTADNSANLYDIGIYGPACSSGATSVPLVAHTGAIAGSAINAGATGSTTIALSGAPVSTSLTEGWYCLAITSSAATPTLVLGGDGAQSLVRFGNGTAPASSTGVTSGGALNSTITAPALAYTVTTPVSKPWVFLY